MKPGREELQQDRMEDGQEQLAFPIRPEQGSFYFEVPDPLEQMANVKQGISVPNSNEVSHNEISFGRAVSP